MFSPSISSSNLAADERPRLDGGYGVLSEVCNLCNRTRGTVLLVRNVGDTRFF
jgi:hypothetical protein